MVFFFFGGGGGWFLCMFWGWFFLPVYNIGLVCNKIALGCVFLVDMFFRKNTSVRKKYIGAYVSVCVCVALVETYLYL